MIDRIRMRCLLYSAAVRVEAVTIERRQDQVVDVVGAAGIEQEATPLPDQQRQIIGRFRRCRPGDRRNRITGSGGNFMKWLLTPGA